MGLAALALIACSSTDDAPGEDELLAAEVEAHLREEVLPHWYPNAVDPDGGFGPVFAEDWTKVPATERFIIFQTRMTWTAAEIARRFDDLRDEYLGYANHGLSFLRDCMADPDQEALFWSVNVNCQSSHSGSHSKHAYGIAFAIYAASTLARAEPSNVEALELAVRWFEWLDAHGHDVENGGYHQAFDSAGAPLLGDVAGADKLGEPYGIKGMNTHIHLLEAFTELARAGELDLVRPRLLEIFNLIQERFISDQDYLHQQFSTTWSLNAKPVTYGHDVETAFLLIEAAEVLGLKDDSVVDTARALVDTAIDHGYDLEHGGFFHAGDPILGPTDTKKVWWVQAEGLNALSLMDELFEDETDGYHELFLDQWRFILEHQVDPVYGDWYNEVEADGTSISGGLKAGPWKAMYHHGRALMHVAERLRR